MKSAPSTGGKKRTSVAAARRATRTTRAPDVLRAAPPDAAAPKERGGIQSIERAFAILEQVARHRDGITLAELCKSVGLHSSTTFHLVRTMAQLGYANQDAETKKYRIGRKIFTLAVGALDEKELAKRAAAMLERLTERTGEGSHFAIRSGDDIVIIAKTGGAGMFQLVDRAGVVRPPHATALGKVLLAAMTGPQLERLLDRRELARYTPKTIVERDALMAEIEQVRRDGIAFDDGELDAEVRCVAVPVRDFLGRVAGAIGISGPMWRLPLQSLHEKSKLVRQSAAELSLELGYRGEADSAHP